MSRPLLISDCDEVILHFIPHFAEWVEEAAELSFDLTAGFAGALKSRDGRIVPQERAWSLLDLFFEREMHRQNVVPGAVAALKAIGEAADIVILTNIGDDYQANRVAQLEAFEIRHRVLCNQGGKGRPVRELVETMRPGPAVFVDDLAVHHESVAKHAPEVSRLHMIADPSLAALTPPAPHADARIDDWDAALPWILARLGGESGR
ncbi:MAG: HAD family hydrolase [Sphingosinicella sp.]|uniref:HAD family hydrolase n=1 Tax=Sphingosinicella sp. TaxID=1917971 RepID=UPI00403831AE